MAHDPLDPDTYISIGKLGTGGTGYTFANPVTTNAKIHVQGDAVFDGDIQVQGRSIMDTLESIEQRLAILVPNVRLEQDWKELQNLRQQYVELERKLLEQQRVFDILKKSD
jgi:hypothetical protein